MPACTILQVPGPSWRVVGLWLFIFAPLSNAMMQHERNRMRDVCTCTKENSPPTTVPMQCWDCDLQSLGDGHFLCVAFDGGTFLQTIVFGPNQEILFERRVGFSENTRFPRSVSPMVSMLIASSVGQSNCPRCALASPCSRQGRPMWRTRTAGLPRQVLLLLVKSAPFAEWHFHLGAHDFSLGPTLSGKLGLPCIQENGRTVSPLFQVPDLMHNLSTVGSYPTMILLRHDSPSQKRGVFNAEIRHVWGTEQGFATATVGRLSKERRPIRRLRAKFSRERSAEKLL